MPKLEQNLKQSLLENGYNYFLSNEKQMLSENVTENDATHIVVFEDNNPFNMKDIKLPKKKLVTLQWIMEKINKDSIYKNFAKNFENLLPEKYKHGLNVYPTSYGIGVFILFSHFHKTDLVNEVSKILDQYGIKYETEYSDAGWVFRFKISKEKSNINKINKVLS